MQHNNMINKCHLFVLLVLLCFNCIWSGCSSNHDEYITDTNISILQRNKGYMEYLLNNSTFGTAPGTYPESSKAILNTEISDLDTHISDLKNGGGITTNELEAVVAKVNQTIDQFKFSRLYNLPTEVQEYVKTLNAKATEYETILNDNSKWGNHKDQYPISSKTILQKAIDNLDNIIEQVLSGTIVDFTETAYQEALQSATDAMSALEKTKLTEDHVTWNLYVDGNNGGWIDFGYSDDYVKFGDNNNQAFTIELWVDVKEYCNQPGEDNSTFLSTMISRDYWSGWRAQDRCKGLLRTMVAHWEDDGPSNPQEWEPGWRKSDSPWTQNTWTHYAFMFRDKGLPGFDTPTDVKCYSMINGERNGDIIRVGEPWRTYINDNSMKYKVHMTGFCALDDNGNRKEWFSGYIKKIRIWKTNRTEDQIRQSYLGVNSDVTADNPDLVAAWDFESVGEKPTGNTFTDITGRHVATINGAYQWVENSTINQ